MFTARYELSVCMYNSCINLHFLGPPASAQSVPKIHSALHALTQPSKHQIEPNCSPVSAVHQAVHFSLPSLHFIKLFFAFSLPLPEGREDMACQVSEQEIFYFQ